MEPIYDVAIIGGGPAGSTAATLLARKNRRVVVIEREKFPRFHIGESLLPYSMATFERLGVREKLDRTFLPKLGAEFATSCGTRAIKFFFKDGFRLTHRQSYQLPRADFDKLLLDHAAQNGAEIREETSVENLAFGGDGVTLTTREKNSGASEEIRARYLIDCSGRNAVVGSFFKLKKSYAHLQKFSVFAHFENVFREEGDGAFLTRLVRAHDSWFWIIPISETRTSIGVVMDTAAFREMKRSPEDVLAHSLARQPVMRRRMAGATRVSPVYSVGDYSYRNTSLVGDRWMLAGDAAGFIDPIFSTGVFLALLSGEQAADAIDVALADPRRKRPLFKKYERSLNRVMDMYLRFVNSWYRPEFAELFAAPTHRFNLAPAINSVLAGNIGNDFAIWWRMQLFYFFLFVQRYVPLCPRLSLETKTEAPSPAIATP
jgi:flavin-dependent dehydrogenase